MINIIKELGACPSHGSLVDVLWACHTLLPPQTESVLKQLVRKYIVRSRTVGTE